MAKPSKYIQWGGGWEDNKPIKTKLYNQRNPNNNMSSPTKKEFLSKTKLEFYKEIKKYQSKLKPSKEIEGYASAAIVGEQNYPNPKIYNVSTGQKDNSFFKTNEVVKKDYSDIVKLKAQNILGNTNNIYIKKTNTRIITEINDVYKARKPAQFESQFDKELKFNKPILNKLSGVLGTQNELINVELTENASTSKQIEKYTDDDIKARQAIINLYEKGIPESQIINLLGLGNFGIQLNRKVVPTRWSISAYDVAIEKHLHSIITKHNPINQYEVYYAKDKGNEFVIVLAPDGYTFENLEFGDEWNGSDYVGHNNKLPYQTPNTAGGFYASKVAIFEHLRKRKKQAQIYCIRLIEGYDIPLGVVFVRETIRQAMTNQIFKTSNFQTLKKYLLENHTQHYKQLINSKTLQENKTQKKLKDYF